MKEKIGFATYETVSGATVWTVYLMYPGGIWDESKLTKEEAEAAYPLDQYEWFELEDE